MKIKEIFKICEKNGISTYEFFKERNFKPTINTFSGEHKINYICKDFWVYCDYRSFCCCADTNINLNEVVK